MLKAITDFNSDRLICYHLLDFLFDFFLTSSVYRNIERHFAFII